MPRGSPERDRVLGHQRKVIRPADFTDLGELADRLERFEDRYNATARPFDWRFTTTDARCRRARHGGAGHLRRGGAGRQGLEAGGQWPEGRR